MQNDLKTTCFNTCSAISALAEQVRELMNHDEFYNPNENTGEMKANIMLSYRHLEDAVTRLGKIMRYL